MGTNLFAGMFAGQLKARDEALSILRRSKKALKSKYGVTDLLLYGPILEARMEPNSAVDVLVRFKGRTTFNKYFGTKCYLEKQLGCSVRLATDASLRDEMRPHAVEDGLHA